MQGEEGKKIAMWHLGADIFGLKLTRMGEKSVLTTGVGVAFSTPIRIRLVTLSDVLIRVASLCRSAY